MKCTCICSSAQMVQGRASNRNKMKSVLLPLIITCFASDSLCFRCYQCFSHLSWEDCNKHAIETDECKPPNVCYMAHRIFQRKGQQRHNFIKACYSPRWCPQERCRQTTQTSVDGSWCETKCCKEKDLCNTGMTPSWERAYVGKESAVNQNVPHKVCFLITVLLAMLTA